MENPEKCSRRSWEENTYWKHFHSVHFFQILPSNFQQHLKLPEKFTSNEIAKLPENVIVKGPNGIIWHVNLQSNDSNHVMLTGDVWQEFVKAYSLQNNDLLTFKYNRTDKSFEVLFFDQTNSCERESSYFVRKCEQPQSNGGFDEQAKSDSFDKIICSSDSTAHTETDRDLDDERDEDEDENEPSRKSNKHKSTSKQPNSLKKNQSTPKEALSNHSRKRKFTRFDKGERDKRKAFIIEDDSISKKNNSLKVNGSNLNKTRSHSAARVSNRNDVPIYVRMSRKSSTVVAAAASYISNRRPVTDEEKEKAYVLATKYATDESFIVVMKPSQVYNNFALVIPQSWNYKGFSRDKRQEVILRTNDNTWEVSFCIINRRGHGAFRGGWKKFALDNFLEESDSCLFVPGGQENKRFVLDVSIFRVVPEVTPLSPVH
ncbi:B3 domain-containing protein REM16-like [Chenopodium quinoa]|uniref:B3 domain-containing protein REM16-like n=1 Tax=Chenopodium quinoa TaxID=63459 RepID=UPI000B785B5D|nr:B3 domain-containing protein REM16-like [Chenopodium quinoa]